MTTFDPSHPFFCRNKKSDLECLLFFHEWMNGWICTSGHGLVILSMNHSLVYHSLVYRCPFENRFSKVRSQGIKHCQRHNGPRVLSPQLKSSQQQKHVDCWVIIVDMVCSLWPLFLLLGIFTQLMKYVVFLFFCILYTLGPLCLWQRLQNSTSGISCFRIPFYFL